MAREKLSPKGREGAVAVFQSRLNVLYAAEAQMQKVVGNPDQKEADKAVANLEKAKERYNKIYQLLLQDSGITPIPSNR